MVDFDDSDSDDDLLNFQAFAAPKTKRQENNEKRKIAKGFSILQNALKNANERKEYDMRIAQIKKDNTTVKEKTNIIITSNNNDDSNENICTNDNEEKGKRKHNNNKSDDDEDDDAKFMARVEQSIADAKNGTNKKNTTDQDQQQQLRENIANGMIQDLENVLGKQHCITLGKAYDVELSTSLGSQKYIISYCPTRYQMSSETTTTTTTTSTNTNNTLYFDLPTTTMKQSILKLKEILRRLVAPNKRLLQLAWIQPLRKVMTVSKKARNASNNNNNNNNNHRKDFIIFLQECYLAKLQFQHELSSHEIPTDILLWLLRIACSITNSNNNNNNGNDDAIREGALTTLIALIELNKQSWNVMISENNESSTATNTCSTDTPTRPSFLCLSELAIQLYSWIPLSSNTSTLLVNRSTRGNTNCNKDKKCSNTETSTDTTNNNDNTTERNKQTRTSTRIAAATIASMTTKSLDENNDNNNDEQKQEESNINANASNKKYPENNDAIVTSTDSTNNNIKGLERLLTFWNKALDSNVVSVHSNNNISLNNAAVTASDDATCCLIMLIKMGLDRCVHSTERNYQLANHIKYAISKILELVANQNVAFQQQDEMILVSWMKNTIKTIVLELEKCNLGSQGDDNATTQDENGWLSYALICRMLPLTSQSINDKKRKRKQAYRFQKSAAQFAALTCTHLLGHLFFHSNDDDDEVDNDDSRQKSWEEEVYAVLDRCHTDSKGRKLDETNLLLDRARTSLSWLVLCSSLTTVVKLNELRGSIENDSAKVLALVEIGLGSCLNAGTELFKELNEEKAMGGKPEDDIKRQNEYKNEENALAFARLLDLLRLQCIPLGGRMNAAMMNPNFSRVAYIVQCYIKYFSETVEKAAYLGGKRASVQNTLDGWLGKARGSGKKIQSSILSDDEDVDDDDDDDDEESPRKKQKANSQAQVSSSC